MKQPKPETDRGTADRSEHVQPETPSPDSEHLHRQIALFLLAVHKSEHGDQPHKVETSWMSAVIRRLASQRNQTAACDLKSLERRLTEELQQQNRPQTEVQNILTWAHARLTEILNPTR